MSGLRLRKGDGGVHPEDRKFRTGGREGGPFSGPSREGDWRFHEMMGGGGDRSPPK